MITTTAVTMISAATAVRIESSSSRIAQPSSTATTGLT
jgi:hypothetical protein